MLTSATLVRYFPHPGIRPTWDCKALPFSHLRCAKYAARHVAVRVRPSCFPDGGVQCVAAKGAGRLDWKLQDIALLRKQYVTCVAFQSQEKSCCRVSNQEANVLLRRRRFGKVPAVFNPQLINKLRRVSDIVQRRKRGGDLPPIRQIVENTLHFHGFRNSEMAKPRRYDPMSCTVSPRLCDPPRSNLLPQGPQWFVPPSECGHALVR